MSYKPDHCRYKDSTVIMYCINCPDRFTCYPQVYESRPSIIYMNEEAGKVAEIIYKIQTGAII